MSTISFRNTPVTIGGTAIIATQASISETIGFERVEGLGRSTVSKVMSERPNTTFTAEFYIDASSYGKLTAYTGLSQFNVEIGGTTLTGLFLTQTSITVDANTLIKGSLNAVTYGSQNWSFASQTGTSMSDAKSTLAHGIATTIGGVVGDFRSISLNISQNITPQYEIGSSTLLGVKYDGGEITASVEGFSPQNRAADICIDSDKEINLSLKSMCNDSIGTLNLSGFSVRSSDVNISVGEDLIGKMELVKYF